MVAYECDGCLTLIWKDEVPELFSEGQSVAATYPDDPFPYEHIDYWQICYSVTSRSIEHKALANIMNESTGFGFSLN